MRWLIWREYRLNRPSLIFGAVMLLLPYLIALIALWYGERHEIHSGPNDRSDMFVVAAIFSIYLSQLTLGVLGGNALAGERADRSAEFMAYLPVARSRRLVAKVIVAAAAAAVVWTLNGSVLGAFLSPSWVGMPVDLWKILGYTAITGMTFYGVGWFVSSFQSSPTFAVAAGLLTPLAIAMGLQLLHWSTGDLIAQFDEMRGLLYVSSTSVVASVGFFAGTVYYLRRVEP